MPEGGVEDAAAAVALRPGDGERRLDGEQQVHARGIEVLEPIDLFEERMRRLARRRRRVRTRAYDDADKRLVRMRLELAAEHLDVVGPVVPRIARAVHAEECAAVVDPSEQRRAR